MGGLDPVSLEEAEEAKKAEKGEMKPKPKPRPCCICGEPIEAYRDGDRWVWASSDVHRFGDALGHVFCMRHAELIRRIMAIEKRLGMGEE